MKTLHSRVPHMTKEHKELIKRRRLQLTVHSYLYYELNETIVDDHQWQDWANELVDLQALYNNAPIGVYDDIFEGWDGSTGYHLSRGDDVAIKASHLLSITSIMPRHCGGIIDPTTKQQRGNTREHTTQPSDNYTGNKGRKDITVSSPINRLRRNQNSAKTTRG